ncbi:MipA/OmpV family protein [Tistrella bauzanensis]|uniref:MipA/OmpV family protein n=1 Tax=Tistrella TaxID=171436 RepID=UPI0031F649DB
MTRAFALMRPVAAGLWLTLGGLAMAAAAPAQAASAPAPAKPAEDHWTLGAGVAAVPVFQGSEEYKAQPLPLVDVQYGRLFAKVGDGIGVHIIRAPRFTAGIAVNWMQGYDQDDVPAGLNGVDDALGARLFVSGRYRGAVATLAVTQAVTETDRGMLISAGLGYPVQATDRLTITPSLGATWANARYMTSYFGVDASEAAASGFDRYTPTSGFKDISLRVSASYRITDSIRAVGSVGATQLLGDAADSPFVEQKAQPIALMGLTYTF